jgi:serine/threonine-protein kinase ULK1
LHYNDLTYRLSFHLTLIFSPLLWSLPVEGTCVIFNGTPALTIAAMPGKTTAPTLVGPPIGTLIDGGKLELVEVLGVGGYGVVYRAVDIHSSRPKSYAVKCLVHSKHHNARQRHLHIREITLHQLTSKHPNVVSLHRVIEEANNTYLIMDFAPDGDLFSQILHNSRYLGDDYLIKHVFLQILDAVEHCHSLGIYHRDLKPENVLCFDDGLQVAVTDFGLATTEKVSEEFRTGSVYHMSPGKPKLAWYVPLETNNNRIIRMPRWNVCSKRHILAAH